MSVLRLPVALLWLIRLRLLVVLGLDERPGGPRRCGGRGALDEFLRRARENAETLYSACSCTGSSSGSTGQSFQRRSSA